MVDIQEHSHQLGDPQESYSFSQILKKSQELDKDNQSGH